MCLFPLITMATTNDPKEKDEKNVYQFLDYMATYPNTVVIFNALGMILRADTDVSYLTELEACSRAAGYIFLDSIPLKCARELLCCPVHVNCKILNVFASYAAEAETRGFFLTGRYVIIIPKKQKK